jgi:hypothetical protein
MNQFSMWHWVIVLFLAGIPVAVLGLIVWLVVRASRRPVASAATALPASSRPSVESRLQELNDLKDKKLITDAEYEQQRVSILREV